MKWDELSQERENRISRFLTSILALINQRSPLDLLGKAYELWKRTGWTGIYQRLATLGQSYPQWISLYDTLNNEDRQMIMEHIARLKHTPFISVLMPASGQSRQFLRNAIESVQSQLYPNWELCIVDDSAPSSDLHAAIEKFTSLDSRICHFRLKECRTLSEAINSALEKARGEFITILNSTDRLSEHALYMVAAAINDKPHVDLIYSDEDKIDNKGRRFDPYFKPEWDPDLFVAQDEDSHLCVYRKTVARDMGGFREIHKCLDLALRLSESIPTTHIHHIPHVLYHQRNFPSGNALNIGEVSHQGSTPIIDYLTRSGRNAKAIPLTEGGFRIIDQVPAPAPLVSIIIPTYNGLSLLSRCIDSIKQKSSYPNYEILVVDNRSDDSNTLEYLDLINKKGIAKVLKYNHPFNYSAINNFAAGYAKGEFLCLMNNDIEVISTDWLEEMVSKSARPDMGAVGAMLYYPNNTIQHAGVLVGMGGVAGHLYAGSSRGTRGYKHRARLAQNLSAVTAACLLVRTRTYHEIGGLDEINLAVAFNDVDFCLRLKEHGYQNFWTPFAECYHHESATRGLDDVGEKLLRFQSEIAYMRSRWAQVLENDSAHNPNLNLDNAYPHPSFPPRSTKPWRESIADSQSGTNILPTH